MEKKGNIFTIFLLIVLIIIIIVMGFFIYKLYNEKNIEKQKVAELEDQIDLLNDKNKENVIYLSDIVSNDNSNENYKLEDLTYDIVLNDWTSKNDDIIGGYANTYESKLVNSDKKEMYTISYSDVWEMHEDSGDKDSVSIEVRKISDKKISNITNTAIIQNKSAVKDYINSHIKTEYDLKIVYQSIDDIKYDIIVNSNTSTLDGDAIEYYYELVNSQLMKKYRVYVDDLSEILNNEGKDDLIIVESDIISEDELNQIKSNNQNKDLELLNLCDLIKNYINDDFKIYVNE